MQTVLDIGDKGPRTGTRGILAGIAGGVLAFALVSQAVVAFYRAGNDWSDIPVLPDKLAALEGSLDDYDVIVAGSSHEYRNFDPAAFDATMRASGCPVRSFNMGVPGLNVVELRHIIDRLAVTGAQRPQWFFVGDIPPVRPTSFGSERSRFTMGLPTLPLALRDIYTASPEPLHKLKIFSLVVYGHVYEGVGTGMLSSRLFGDAATADERRFWSYSIARDRAGYLPLDDEEAQQFAIRRERLAADLPAFERLLAQSGVATSAKSRAGLNARLSFIERTLTRARRVAPNVGLVLMPNPEKVAYSAMLAAEARRIGWRYPVINLNDPNRYPLLTDSRQWFDKGHLNARGAAQISAAMAREICRPGSAP